MPLGGGLILALSVSCFRFVSARPLPFEAPNAIFFELFYVFAVVP